MEGTYMPSLPDAVGRGLDEIDYRGRGGEHGEIVGPSLLDAAEGLIDEIDCKAKYSVVPVKYGAVTSLLDATGGRLNVTAGAAVSGKPSLLCLAEGAFDEIGFQANDGATVACSESTISSPIEDALAVEVGQCAHEYLEECFYTEMSILDRDKFDAVPELATSDFTVLRHLGKGTFSDVFEVQLNSCKGGELMDAEASDKPAYALKCLRPQIRHDSEQFTIGAEDLVHETAMLANLSHRHIICLHGRASGHLMDAFALNDGYFILIDRLSETLRERMEGWKMKPECTTRGPSKDQLEVARCVADAMCYLHSKSVIFRDLKPANVGFDSGGVLKLYDFGFAAGLPEKDEVSNPSGLLFDKCGTPRYMAPEVGLSLGYGLPADVYSFGILLWEICALDGPFRSIKSSNAFERYVFMGGERPPVEAHWPAAVKEFMRGCWTPAPGKRPTMQEVKWALSRKNPPNIVRRPAMTRSMFTR